MNCELVFFEFLKIAEAMYEQTPKFFLKFRKNFRYHSCFENRLRGKIPKTTSVMLLVYTLKKANSVTLSKNIFIFWNQGPIFTSGEEGTLCRVEIQLSRLCYTRLVIKVER